MPVSQEDDARAGQECTKTSVFCKGVPLLFLLVLGVRSCHTHHLSAARHTSCVGASDGHRAQSGKRRQSPQGALPAP